MSCHVDIQRLRRGLMVSLIIISVGIVVDLLFSADAALDVGLLLVAAAVIALVLFLTRHARRRRPSRTLLYSSGNQPISQICPSGSDA